MTSKKQTSEAAVVERDESKQSTQVSERSDANVDRGTALLELALSKSADISVIERLVNLQNDFEDKAARKAFFAAMSRFQSELPVIEKKGKAEFDHKHGGGKTEYNYAKIEHIAEAIKPLLIKHGFSYRYKQEQSQGLITVTCVVTHEDGHEEEMSMSAGADQTGSKNGIQQISSAVSYMRRYTLTGSFGISTADEDNDAQTYDEKPKETAQDYYPEDEFKRQFPIWEKQILDGHKTAEQIIKYLKGKNVNLSEKQVKQVKKVGAAQ